MDITVYTKHNCVQCDQTKRVLDRAGVEYKIINVEEDARAYAFIVEQGFKSAPVVIADGHKWAGFKLDNLKQLAQEYNMEKNKAS